MSRFYQAAGGRSRRWPPRLTLAQKWVIALGCLGLALGLANLGRMGFALRYAAPLPDLPLTVSWTYLAATGGFWGLVFLVCAVGLMRFRRWGRWGTLVAVTLYEIHAWVNHLLFDASDYARQTRPRDLLLTLLLLAFTWGLLNWPNVRNTFRPPTQQAPHAVGGSVTANPRQPKENEK
jgi:hypothetical protein